MSPRFIDPRPSSDGPRVHADPFAAHAAAIVDSSVVAIWAETRDGVVTSWNPAAADLYGYAAVDMLGRPASVLVPDDRRAEHAELRRRVRAGEVVGHRWTERLRRDGARLVVSEALSPIHAPDGALIGLSSISRDITADITVERSLGEVAGVAGLFESSFESAPIGMVLVGAGGDRPGSLLRVNRAMARMVGREEAALRGRHFYDLIHEDDVADLLPSIECLLAGLDVGPHHAEVRFRGADGQPVPGELSVSLIRDAAGEPLHAVALAHDSAPARRAQAEPETLAARAHEDGIGRLAGGIAHDLNNLLSVIINYADLVAEDLPTGALRGDVEQILEAAERAAALTRELLVVGRQERVQPPAAVEAAEPPPGRGERVLVVEDEPAVRALAARLLTDGGYRVLEAGRPEDALVVAGDDPPELLLTDVEMPGMSGIDLGARLRHTQPDLRILFMSGHTDDVVLRRGILQRWASFVEKPFSRASLLGAVRATLDDATEAPRVH